MGLCLSKWIGTRKTISALKDKEKIPKKAKAQTSLTNIHGKLNRRGFLSINGEPVNILLQPKPSPKMLTSPPLIYIVEYLLELLLLPTLRGFLLHTIVIGEFQHWTSLNDSVCFCGPKNEKKE